jgi:hypothetical protein
MLGFEKTCEILDKLNELNNRYYNENKQDISYTYNTCRVLLLGLKQVGRGKKLEHKLFNEDELDLLRRKSGYQYNVDTAFINTYDNWFKEQYSDSEQFFLTRHEGEYSMFIDAVKNMAYSSSYKDDGGIDVSNIDKISDVFGDIRRKNGFKVFERPVPYYRK